MKYLNKILIYFKKIFVLLFLFFVSICFYLLWRCKNDKFYNKTE